MIRFLVSFSGGLFLLIVHKHLLCLLEISESMFSVNNGQMGWI